MGLPLMRMARPITGFTTSRDFPVTTGAFMTVFPGGGCNFPGCFFHGIDVYTLPSAFVAKFDPLGSGSASLIYSTFLGGSPGTVGNGLAVDTLGNAYVTGSTGDQYGPPQPYVPFPTTPGAYQAVPDYNDAYVTKLNAAGNNLIYSTLLGASQCGDYCQFATAIALDAANDDYVTGSGTGYELSNNTECQYRNIDLG
jgi:hypothetical protein